MIGTDFVRFRRGYTTKDDMLKFISDLENNNPNDPNGGGNKVTTSEGARSITLEELSLEEKEKREAEIDKRISDILSKKIQSPKSNIGNSANRLTKSEYPPVETGAQSAEFSDAKVAKKDRKQKLFVKQSCHFH